jgi:adenylosuccinate lyase
MNGIFLLDFMIADMASIIENLLVYPANMERNLHATRGLIFSQEVLLALTKKGMKREDAYRVVQEQAMKVWQDGSEFKSLLRFSAEVMGLLSEKELDELFDAKRSLRHVDHIFEQVGIN